MKAFGSGHFGEWLTDGNQLPFYRYTCDQNSDPAAVTPTNPTWRGATDHTFQFGNDRIIAVASNAGVVQVRQDENAPKLLQDILPGQGCYGGGFGWLTDGSNVLSTHYDTPHDTFERDYGVGYLRKSATAGDLNVSTLLFAPFGDDPVLISRVTVQNDGAAPKDLRWFEYWGTQHYPLSFRTLMISLGQSTKNLESLINNPALPMRRAFAERFKHNYDRTLDVLDHRLVFKGWGFKNKLVWRFVQKKFRPLADTAKNASLYVGELDDTEDLQPPPQFFAAVDTPLSGFLTDGKRFFGAGGLARPDGLANPVFGRKKPADNAMVAVSSFMLAPGERKTLTFLYGYVPKGFTKDALLKKYSGDFDRIFADSCAAWRQDRIALELPGQPHIDREMQWHHHALRSAQTFDDGFGEHILSQGHLYQYIMGFQGAARDPLQHVLPFIFNNPKLVREIIRYTCKEILPDGEIPYGIMGHGQIMLSPILSSDFELWLIWTVSEYILAQKDPSILFEKVAPFPYRGVRYPEETVLSLLMRCYNHFVDNTGKGDNGLPHLLGGDWNDNIVMGSISTEQHEAIRKEGESVLVGAMGANVLARFADALELAGQTGDEQRAYAQSLREAVRACWNGKWLKRAYLSSELGWVGDDMLWLEPQPWALLCDAVDEPDVLIRNIEKMVQAPSPIGAMISSACPPQMNTPKGTVTNGGIWPSINGTLILALAQRDAAAAWVEWKKNTLAQHAEAYPNSWEGIWSGPDTYNSILAETPGRAYAEPDKEKREQILNWSDYPVYNLHPHAWTLYNAACLFAREFTADGVVFSLDFPEAEFRFASPLAGLARTGGKVAGWYAPQVPGEYRVTLVGAPAGAKLSVNGMPAAGSTDGSRLTFTGASADGQPLRFELN